MPEVLEVADSIFRIHARVPTMDLVCTFYLIDDGGGMVVDPGPGSSVPMILDAMKQVGMDGLRYIVPTHIHVDHGGACGSLSRLFPDARVVVHPVAKGDVLSPSRLIESTRKSYGDRFEESLGPILDVPESQLDVPADSGILGSSRRLKVVYSPGHSPHHLSFLDLKTGGLFCGEALGLRTKSARLSPLPNAAPPGFDMELYLETIENLHRLKPRILFFAHDGVARDPDEIEVIFREVAQNTGKLGDIILCEVEKGRSFEEILDTLKCTAQRDFSINPGEVNLTTILAGFTVYFRRKNGQARMNGAPG